MKTLKKIECLVLCLVMLVFSCGIAYASEGVLTSCGGKDTTPAVVIPGLFQCEAYAYDEKGELLLDSDGNVRTAPFFLDTSDIIRKAINTTLLPLAKTVLTQKDGEEKFANALADLLGSSLMEQVKSDETGHLIHDVRAVEYTTSFAKMSEHDKAWALDAVPLQSFIEKVGEDHLYFYSYFSLDNLEDITAGLYNLIQQVKKETGHDKVNIVPISQGGTICNCLLENYPQVVNDLNRIVYIVPASDGSDIFGDFFTEGIIDDDDALYGYMVPSLLKRISGSDQEWIGYLVNMLLRIFPKDVLNNVLDKAVQKLIGDYISYSTALWALVPSDHYAQASKTYLSGDDKAQIKKQTDAYYKAQVGAKDNILKVMEKGVTVFDVCGYNTPFYPIVDSWNKENADGIIQLKSTSFGATSAPVDGKLPDGYKQQNTSPTCKDKTHNHIDPYNMVDASTGLLADNTFYFYGLNHEKTGASDVVISCAVTLLTDESYTDVYSHPDVYPQFNNFRFTKYTVKNIAEYSDFDYSTVTPETGAELKAALDGINTVLGKTIVDIDEFDAANSRLDAAIAAVNSEINPEYSKNQQSESFKSMLINILTKLLKVVNELMRKFLGDNGYSDTVKKFIG